MCISKYASVKGKLINNKDLTIIYLIGEMIYFKEILLKINVRRIV
jgi:hypothetical protein